MKIERDGKIYELTHDELMRAKREAGIAYLISDAECLVREFMEFFDITLNDLQMSEAAIDIAEELYDNDYDPERCIGWGIPDDIKEYCRANFATTFNC